jgi:DNA-binding GntR family transcriptional regulator
LALSRRLNVSRASLREAVRGLEQLALVDIVPTCGVLVRQVSIKDALDLYDLRAALFRGAARLAMRRALPEALAELSHLNVGKREAAAAERYADYYISKLQFHAALMTTSGNAPMARAYDRAVKSLHLFRRRSLVHPTQLNLSLHEYEELLAAIAAHDTVAVAEVADRHIELGRNRMLDTLENGAPARAAPDPTQRSRDETP